VRIATALFVVALLGAQSDARAEAAFSAGDVLVAGRHGGIFVAKDGEIGDPVVRSIVVFDLEVRGKTGVYVLLGRPPVGRRAIARIWRDLTLHFFPSDVPLESATAFAIERLGRFVVALDETSDAEAQIVRIRPATGAAEVLASGPLLNRVQRLLVLRDGTLLGSTSEHLVRVDPATGAQEMWVALSDLADDRPSYADTPLAQTCDGTVLVGLQSERINSYLRETVVVSIDPTSGEIQARMTFPTAPGLFDLQVSDDKLWMVGIHSVHRFDLRTLKAEAVVPRTGPRIRNLAVLPKEGAPRCIPGRAEGRPERN